VPYIYKKYIVYNKQSFFSQTHTHKHTHTYEHEHMKTQFVKWRFPFVSKRCTNFDGKGWRTHGFWKGSAATNSYIEFSRPPNTDFHSVFLCPGRVIWLRGYARVGISLNAEWKNNNQANKRMCTLLTPNVWCLFVLSACADVCIITRPCTGWGVRCLSCL
jgi:hypothetical protein